MLRPLLGSLFISLLVLTFVSCGKDSGPLNSREDGYHPFPLPSDLEEYLNQHKIICEPGNECPGYMAKIVVLFEGKKRFCTGTLVSPRTVVTSASCLPKNLRSTDMPCKNAVHFFFYRGKNRPLLRTGCENILQASELAGRDPILWRDDVAFLELNRAIYFPKHKIIEKNKELEARGDLQMISFEQKDEFTSSMRFSECRPYFNSYINPLANHPSSPNIIIAGCPLLNGSSGAPFFDNKMKVRALASSAMDPALRESLQNSGMLEGPSLKPITHATNFACAPALLDDSMINPKECSKPLDYAGLDEERKKMMLPENVFEKFVNDVRSGISNNSFLSFDVRLKAAGDNSFAPEIYPKCFRNPTWWIRRYQNVGQINFKISAPDSIFRKTMDPNGKVVPKKSETTNRSYFVSFNPSIFKERKATDVIVFNGESRQRFDDISECVDSLF